METKDNLSIYLSGFTTAVAVFWKPNAIPLCFSTDLVPNFLLSWLLVLLPSTFLPRIIFGERMEISKDKEVTQMEDKCI